MPRDATMTAVSGIVRALVGACHPEPTVGVTALATALTAAAGGSAERVTLVAVTVLAGQLSIGWSNDAIDAARDVASGRTDKPVATGRIGSRVVGGAAVAALAVAVAVSFVAGPAAALAHLVVLAGGWAYNLGLKRTLLSWLPYAVAFGALPAYSVLALPGAAVPAPWLVATGSLLGVGAHFFNVLPDIADDRATGVRSLRYAWGRPPAAGRAADASSPRRACSSWALPALVGRPGSPGWCWPPRSPSRRHSQAARAAGRGHPSCSPCSRRRSIWRCSSCSSTAAQSLGEPSLRCARQLAAFSCRRTRSSST
jgi:4-hydroxybenzoate polyprenyltransferase